jgi:AraC family transcriptional regulator, transcriptional activator FtrA
MTGIVDFLPGRGQDGRVPIRDVAVLALPGVNPFELGVACEGFGLDRSDDGIPGYDFAVVSLDDRPVPTSAGWTVTTEHRLDRADRADLVVVPAPGRGPDWPRPALDVVRRAVERGAAVMSICSGAFVLGAAGLLDDRDCTTHWRYTDELAARFPRARVKPDVLYVCDGPVYTSAGTASGLDLCLHLIRRDHGAEVATGVARRMVMPPHRDGGQAQYVTARMPEVSPDCSLAALLDALLGELEQPHTVESMAARAALSPRTFARRFREETGTSPHAWLTRQRVLHARRLLESTDDPIERIARQAGFTEAAALRHHFTRQVGTAPARYRATFRAP